MTEEITSTPRHTMRCWSFGDLLVPWLRDYDRLQRLAVILIYIQIACALVGSLGAQYNGVLLINLAIALFALVAIESSSQSLGRTYAVLLFCAVLLDITWFILFTHDIWYISSEVYGPYFIFSVRLTLAMQVVGFTVRLSSSFLWIQIYKLGVSNGADYDLRNSFLNPVTPAAVRQSSGSDDAAGSMYDPAYYSSLFEDGQNMKNTFQEHNSCPGDDESPAAAVASRLKPLILRTSETVDVESLETNCQNGSTATNTSNG